jgi:hypothetical protein
MLLISWRHMQLISLRPGINFLVNLQLTINFIEN